MPELNIIKEPIVAEMEQFDAVFKEVLNSDNKLLKSVHDYVIDGKGKKIRPILTLLSAKLVGSINKSTLYAAFGLELLHTASLVHDDVIDHTDERRGKPSVNSKWNNKVAVLTGDYLLSKALYSANLTRNIKILEAVSVIGMVLSDGELLQLTYTNQAEITEEKYIELIRRKTAKLFSACTEVGALSVGASEKETLHLAKFGEYLGLCFQIKDDIFDYIEGAQIGKPTGNDLRDGKVTIPMIYALRSDKSTLREEMLKIINTKDFTDDNVRKLTEYAIQYGGLDYAVELMRKYKQLAIDELSDFPDSSVKKSLLASLEFVTDRKI